MDGVLHFSDLVTLVGVLSAIVGGAWRVSSWNAGLRAELAAYKLEVAEKYVSATAMRELEDRLIASIDRLGDRLDKVFTARVID